MGYFKDLELEIMEMAHDMGDDFGSDASTVIIIAKYFDLLPYQVAAILGDEYAV